MAKKREMAQRPKLSAKKLLQNNFYLIKTIFSASPLGVLLYIAEQARNQIMIFFEHTWLIQTVLECVEYQKPLSSAVIPIVAVLILILISSWLGAVVTQRVLPKVMLRAQTKMKNMIYEKAKDVDLNQFDDPEYYNDFVMTAEKTGDLINRAFRILDVVVTSVTIILTTGVYFVIQNVWAFLLILITSFLHMALALRRSKYFYSKFVTSRKYYRRSDYIKRLFYLQDYAKELRLNADIKNKAMKDYDESFDGLVDNLKYHDKKISILGTLGQIIQTVLLDMVLVLLLVYQASVLGTISYAMVIVLINSAYRLRRSFASIVLNIANSAENCMYVDKVKEFLSRKPKIVSKEKLDVKCEPCSLELKNVSFRYNDTDGDVLHDISFKLKPKEKIAIVGYNGAGKTTLIKLIMRLYDTTAGSVYMDGIDIKKYDVEKYRHNIGVVFQDFNIYGATVKENVVMGIPKNDEDDKVYSALTHSGFDNRLEHMKYGINTGLTKEFDDDGTNLSGGEAQKIAISRAFFKNAGLIILDEPSSALDPIAEYNFNRYMAKAAENCTVIFISHRLSTTRTADRIIMLENGRICEEGTHDELLNKRGKYAEMWHAQADKYLM